MSKLDGLQAKINDKANADAQEAIRVFRQTVAHAVKVLLNGAESDQFSALYHGNPIQVSSPEARCLAVLLSDNPKTAWPGNIWSSRRGSIENEVFSQMNIVQRVLAARAPQVNENTSEITEAS